MVAFNLHKYIDSFNFEIIVTKIDESHQGYIICNLILYHEDNKNIQVRSIKNEIAISARFRVNLPETKLWISGFINPCSTRLADEFCILLT